MLRGLRIKYLKKLIMIVNIQYLFETRHSMTNAMPVRDDSH